MSTADIARRALHRLIELGLPPTPENYEKQYRSFANLPERVPNGLQPGADPTALQMIRALLQVMTSANADLHADLTRFTSESSALLERAEEESDPNALNDVFKAMTVSSSWLMNEVEQMRSELERTRSELDNMQSQLQKAEHLAVSDPLTGLPNRRGLEAVLAREVSRARRHKLPMSLALLDIDHFKRVNDEHGHAAGDRALVHFAQVLRQKIRDVDILGRFGGEEFLLLMPDTPLIGAEFGVNRLLGAIKNAPLQLPHVTLTLRFSAGVAQWRTDEDPAALVARADAAMYAAKSAGRGRVAVAASEEDTVAAVTTAHRA